MIEFKTGNMFDQDCEYIINTVNCVGVMGKGVAFAFKNKYPEMFAEYKKECEVGNIDIGKPFIWKYKDMFEPQIVINLPTKMHWKDPSTLVYIQNGLNWLRNYFENKPNSTVVMPALGCGNGGLDWDTVKNMIQESLEDLKTQFFVYEPGGFSMNQWGN